MGVSGALFWVGGDRWVNILGGWGWVEKYVGWEGVDGGEWE